MDRWKPILGFANYEVNENGAIRNVHTRKTLSTKNDRGYDRVVLYDHGVRSIKQVHRIVAESFIDNPDHKHEVNHINGDKRDNRVQNLEWCTRSDNMKHAYAMGLKHCSGGLDERPVRVLETDQVYKSIHECARCLNCDQGHISHCLSGDRKTHKKYHFEYA